MKWPGMLIVALFLLFSWLARRQSRSPALRVGYAHSRTDIFFKNNSDNKEIQNNKEKIKVSNQRVTPFATIIYYFIGWVFRVSMQNIEIFALQWFNNIHYAFSLDFGRLYII